MNFLIKPHLLVAVLSLSALSINAEAAARADGRRTSETVGRDETLDILKQLSLQMREMQEQISTLKSSQNSLTSDTVVKNLAPKVRRIEMQMDYLEKRFRDQPSYVEVKAVLSEHQELKKQLDSLSKGNFAHSDDTIQAISPVLARMQKQLLFLYDKYKKGGGEASAALSQNVNKLRDEVVHFQKHVAESETNFSSKLSQLQQSMSSMVSLKQHVVGAQSAMAEVEAKVQLMTQEIAQCKGVAEQLAKFKEQVAHHGNLQVKAIAQLTGKLSEFASDDRFRQTAERCQALETSMQQLQEKAALLIGNQKALWEKSKKMPAEEFFAKQRSLETSLTQLQTKLSELGGFLAKHEESLQEVAQLKKEGNDRWQKSTKALLAINNRLKQTGQEHQELKDSVREQIGAMSDKLVKFQEFYVVNAVSAPSHEEGNLSAIKEEIIAKTRKLEEKITNLEEQNQLLYGRVKDFKEGESIPEISSLQKELQSLKEHAEKESQTLHQKMQALNEEHTKTVQELRGRLEEINKTVAFSSSDIEGSDQIQQELKKRDEEIAKLKRRVLYLYKNAHEDSEGKTSNNQIDERFEALKKDMESRISEHLEKTHNDKQAIEMLLKKVAELQALLPVKDLRDSVQ